MVTAKEESRVTPVAGKREWVDGNAILFIWVDVRNW